MPPSPPPSPTYAFGIATTLLLLAATMWLAIVAYRLCRGSDGSSGRFLTLVCRVRNEHALLEEFVPYYLSQGVDKIYLLDDSSSPPYDPRIANHERVEIVPVSKARRTGNESADLAEFYSRRRRETVWLIHVDADEFIVTRRNAGNTIREELETTFRGADCVHIPWVMFGSSGNVSNPASILRSCTKRWSQDVRHPHPLGYPKMRCRYATIEVKSIFRPDKFGALGLHTPKAPASRDVKIVDGVHNRPRANGSISSSFYKSLREADISEAYFTCNHYRTFSREYMRQKCHPSTYLPAYNTSECLRGMALADYNDIEDTVLAKKAPGDHS